MVVLSALVVSFYSRPYNLIGGGATSMHPRSSIYLCLLECFLAAEEWRHSTHSPSINSAGDTDKKVKLARSQSHAKKNIYVFAN
jgi:hypothetical protein